MRGIYRIVKRKTRQWLERSDFGFRLVLKYHCGATGPHGDPDAPWHNSVLKYHRDAQSAVEQVRTLGLSVIKDPPKNWDSLAALDLILKTTDKSARIFDAGGERYSMILPWLFLYGYSHLSAGNLVFAKPSQVGPISYHYADITETGLGSEAFDAITCLSVIEHGVDLRAYFREMSRLLKPGGHLVTSTDYFETKIDTRGQMAYGGPIHIFNKEEISQAIELAAQFGLTPTSNLDLRSEEKVVTWEEFDLQYTFVIFTLRKTGLAV